MKDRIVEFPNRYRMLPVEGEINVFDLEAVPGTITQEGTVLNANNLLKATTEQTMGLPNDSTVDDAFLYIQNNKPDKARRYEATFAAGGWSAEAPYTQSVSVSGILATDVPIADLLIQSEDEEGMAAETEAYGLITKIDTGAGTVTATAAEEAPTADITVQLVVWDINDMTGGE